MEIRPILSPLSPRPLDIILHSSHDIHGRYVRVKAMLQFDGTNCHFQNISGLGLQSTAEQVHPARCGFCRCVLGNTVADNIMVISTLHKDV